MADTAVIKTGGKQYIVSPGNTLKIEKLSGDFKEGDKVTFDSVLMSEKGGKLEIGTPMVAGAKVTAEIKKIGRARKITVVHFKSKTRERKKAGHRQPYFEVEIKGIA